MKNTICKLVLVTLFQFLNHIGTIHYELIDVLFFVGGSDRVFVVFTGLTFWFPLELGELVQLLLHYHLNDEATDEPVLLEPLLELGARHVNLAGAHTLS